ncbi:amidohydrolase [bacterium]|nr:amidohydrolase [bacterium]
MNHQHFGLPSPEQLKQYRIWDSYFTPAHSFPGQDGASVWIAEMERARFAIELGHIQKLCYFAHVGTGTTTNSDLEDKLATDPRIVLKPLQHAPNELLALMQVNSNDIPRSLDAINRWIADGPMHGVYFPGGGPGAAPCTEIRLEKLIRRVIDLKGVIMQHTWFKTGGKQGPGETTPHDLATLSARFPEQTFIAAHAGGEWEKGIRAIRDQPNISIETSGFDATAGFIEMAVREIEASRIIFGSHLPSRSLGTELAKVIHAEISEQAKHLILGVNFRKLIQRSLDHKQN